VASAGYYTVRFGITQSFDCSYLPNQQEQLLVYAESDNQLAWRYGQLIQVGFRRSGEQIYRPHCPDCHACESVRVPVATFRPSKSQKRILNRNQHFVVTSAKSANHLYYPLYEKYICARHTDGSMYPPSSEQFENFILCEWKRPQFIEAYDGDTLIAVAVTDTIDNGEEHQALSALYTFYDPDYHSSSLGTWMIMMQIEQAKQQERDFVYLGYYVEECQKMSYKHNFFPYEQFSGNKWHRFDKKPA
jgi:arginyl-tRNA--protein-N-Asp/Glu arginylyltransferase